MNINRPNDSANLSSELRVELSLPESSIATIRYPDLFPSPPSDDTASHEEFAVVSPCDTISTPGQPITPGRRRRTTFTSEVQLKSWYYYLSEISLRRIGNRLLNTFYSSDNYPGSGMTVPEMVSVAVDFEDQINQWFGSPNIINSKSNVYRYAGLPEAIRFDQRNPRVIPEDELAYMTRSRQLLHMTWLTAPFLYYGIHNPPSDRYQSVVRPYVERALEYAIDIINFLSVRHRHHGTFFGLRCGATASFQLLAARKASHVAMPPGWIGAIRTQLSTHRYWEYESSDIQRTREIIEERLHEFTAV